MLIQSVFFEVLDVGSWKLEVEPYGSNFPKEVKIQK